MAEKLKTAAAVLLGLLLCVQLALSFALIKVSAPLSPCDLLYEALKPEKSSVSPGEELSGQAFPALPCHIALCSERGAYSPFSVEDYKLLCSKTGGIISSAAENASEIGSCDEKAYTKALSSPGILYSYDYPLPFYLFRTDSSEASENLRISSIFACADGELFIRTENDGLLRASSDYDVKKVLSLCADAEPNAVLAAFVPDAGCRSDIPLAVSGFSLPFYITVAPSYAESKNIPAWISDIFSVNRYLSSVYDDFGSLVCVEGDKQIRLGADGSISFSASGEDALPLGISQDDFSLSALRKEAFAVSETALLLWQNASNPECDLSLSEITEEGDTRTYIFDCYISGCLVERSSPACTVSVKNGRMTSLFLLPLCFFEGEETAVFPYIQSAAAQNGKNADLHIHYVATNPTVLMPQMRVIEGGR